MLNTDDMKRDPFRFSPAEFIDWLMGGDVHLIIGHINQGVDHLSWDMDELLEEYKRLECHHGYTRGCNDPVFLQDKIRYLEALDADDSKILISESSLDAIIAFIGLWEGTYKNGWVIKAPFTTHGSIYRGDIYCDDLQAVAKRILHIARLSHHISGYLSKNVPSITS